MPTLGMLLLCVLRIQRLMRHNFCLEGIYHSVVSHAHTHTCTRAHASTHIHTQTNRDCSMLQWQERSHKVMSENYGSHENDTRSSQEAHGRLADSESWMKYLRKDEYELSKKWGWREGKIIPHGIIEIIIRYYVLNIYYVIVTVLVLHGFSSLFLKLTLQIKCSFYHLLHMSNAVESTCREAGIQTQAIWLQNPCY